MNQTMNATKFKAGVVGVLALALVSLLISLQLKVQRLESEKARLKSQVAQLEVLRQENAQLAKRSADAAELERLRKEHAELLRLRGEVSMLRRQSQRAAAAPSQAASPTNQTENATPPVSTYVAKVEANMGDGQTLVTGGWATEPGKRVLVLVTPQINSGVNPGTITFTATFIEAPENVLASLGLEAFRADTKESALGGLLTAEQAQLVLKGLTQAPGVNVMGVPRVTTQDGRQAQLQQVDLKVIPGSDEKVPIGSTIDITPRLSEDGKSVAVSVSAILNQLNQPAP